MIKSPSFLFAAAVLLATISPAAAGAANIAEQKAVGEVIYQRAFGRGCGACHDIASNPQLVELISAGKLPLDKFTKVIKEGKNGMPKGIAVIMGVGPVKKANLTEQQAISDLYLYLKR